jgi:hypothetical protein
MFLALRGKVNSNLESGKTKQKEVNKMNEKNETKYRERLRRFLVRWNVIDDMRAGKGEQITVQVGRQKMPAHLHRNGDKLTAITDNKKRLASGSEGSGGKSLAKRVSMGDPNGYNFMAGLTVFARKSNWRKFALKENVSLAELQKMPIEDIAELLADVSPEVSLALHVRTILSNTGYEIQALKLEVDEVDEVANKALNQMRKCIARYNGTEDVAYNKAFLTLWLRGSVLLELILQDNLKDFADIVNVDPQTLKFRKANDDVRGQVDDFGQYQNGEFISFRQYEQISYIPFMPFPNSIEGRPLISASFFISIFVMAVLRDFKRVIQQQGYPRYAVKIDLEQMKAMMPKDAQDNPAEYAKWAEGLVEQISDHIEGLEPDETFVHTTGVEVPAPVGALGTNSLSALDGLFKSLERMAARALKVPPLFMGIIENVSEANANRQFEGFLKDLQSGQHIIENGYERLYELALQAQGIAARVKFRFQKSRESERVRDAQANILEAQYAAYCEQMGWISHNAAAKLGAKVDQAELEQPLFWGASPNAGNMNGDAGVNRFLQIVPTDQKQRMPTVAQLNNAKNIFEQFAPDAATDLITDRKSVV